jgi:hypothetical protein
MARAQSPITQPDFHKGRKPPNKGRRFPSEPLTAEELAKLLASFPRNTKRGTRNRAMVALMAGAGLKPGQLVNVASGDYREDSGTVVVRGKKPSQDRTVAVRTSMAREAMTDWLAVRDGLRMRATAPLFGGVNKGSIGNRINTAYVREMVREHAEKAGIRRRVNPESIRLTYGVIADQSISRLIHDFIDEETFRHRYPAAYGKWRGALELFLASPQRQVTRIGHDCREALMAFAHEAVDAHRVEVDAEAPETVKKLRAVFNSKGISPRTRDHLLAYFRMTSDLAQRAEHGAAREKEPLTADDARRLVSHTLLAMNETDRALRNA